MGWLECDFIQKGILAKEIRDEEVIPAFVVEVTGYDFLQQAIRDVSGKHGLCWQ